MSRTSRNYDFAQRTFRKSLDKQYDHYGLKSNPIATFRPSTSIYEQLPKRKNNKRNVLQRFHDLCRKMSLKREEKSKRIKVQSITLDLFKQNDDRKTVAECSKIIEDIKQKTIEIERLKSLRSQDIENKMKQKLFKPYKQNKSVRIIYNTGGRIIEYTPLMEREICAKETYKLPKKEASKTYSNNFIKDEEFVPQRYVYQKGSKSERRRVHSVVPKQKKFLETRESFLDNIQPWESQHIVETETYV